MSLDSRLAVPVVLWLGVVGRLAAQEPHAHQAEALGRVVFPVSCIPEAQTRFERAVALLHSFWYERAADTFREAVVTDTAFSYQRRADAILEPLFKAEPRHPGLAHYLIHTNDTPRLARLGLYAARHYAEIAPDVPHAQHMPSHIFTRLGLWNDDIASNLRSAASARAFEDERHLNALWDQRGHAWDYLVYAYLQQGRDAEAKRVVDEAAAVTAVYPVGSLTNAYALAAIPARHALERGRWRGATTLAVRPSPECRAADAP